MGGVCGSMGLQIRAGKRVPNTYMERVMTQRLRDTDTRFANDGLLSRPLSWLRHPATRRVSSLSFLQQSVCLYIRRS